MLTIITPLLNSDPQVLQTFASLQHQLPDGVRWLIKDAAASDAPEALAALRRHPSVRYLNQPDRSLYDGMNQALAAADTEFYMVVGAGDTFEPGAVARILAGMAQAAALDALFFGARAADRDYVFQPQPQLLSSHMSTPHPGAVLRTRLSQALGGYNPGYRIAADYDHLSRYVKQHGAVGIDPFVVTRYAGGGVSETKWFEGYLECQLVRLRVWQCPNAEVQAKLAHDNAAFVASRA